MYDRVLVIIFSVCHARNFLGKFLKFVFLLCCLVGHIDMMGFLETWVAVFCPSLTDQVCIMTHLLPMCALSTSSLIKCRFILSIIGWIPWSWITWKLTTACCLLTTNGWQPMQLGAITPFGSQRLTGSFAWHTSPFVHQVGLSCLSASGYQRSSAGTPGYPSSTMHKAPPRQHRCHEGAGTLYTFLLYIRSGIIQYPPWANRIREQYWYTSLSAATQIQIPPVARSRQKTWERPCPLRLRLFSFSQHIKNCWHD